MSKRLFPRRRRARALPFLAAALIVACGDGEAAQAGGRPSGRPGADRQIPVEVAPVGRGTAARTSVVTGSVEPLRTVGVNAQLSGVLTAVLVEEGDAVGQGQVLARLDDRELAAQLRAAEARLTLVRGSLDRSRQLREAQVITAAELEADQADFAAAEAQLDQLRTRIGFATIRAPIAGVVTEKRLEAGDVASPQARLFTVADLGTLVVRLPVSEIDVAMMRVGEELDLTLDAMPDRTFRGRVRRIFPTADSVSRLIPVEVQLMGEGARRARPGFLARVTLQLDERQNAMLVPANALVGTAGSEAVYVVEGGKAARRPVVTGLRQSGQVEIVQGLTGAETIVVVGTTTLRDGASVRVVNEATDRRQAATDSAARAGATVAPATATPPTVPGGSSR